jgi:Ser/Thr protein kinase RdoA (MazF antagonist)
MHYFGFGSPSKRILIKARGKRAEASILTQLPGVYGLDVALSRGRNESYLLAGAEGPLVAKLLARESRMTLLPEDLCNQMFDEINNCRPQALVAPKRYDGKYLLPGPAGRYWMLFPFVGRLPSSGETKTYPTDFAGLIDLFVKVRRDLRPFSPKLRTILWWHRLFVNVGPILSASVWRADSSQLQEFSNEVEAALSDLITLEPEKLDALCHGDLQSGNVVCDQNDQPRVIDLDNLCVGTIYSDGLTGMMWRGANAQWMASFCEKLAQEETRSVARYDVYLAIANGIAWFSSANRAMGDRILDHEISLLRIGLAQAIQFAAGVCDVKPRLTSQL